MINHELISEEWNKDYPKYADLAKNLSNLDQITLKVENNYNKYWDYYYKACSELYRLENKLEEIEKILKLYYSKKPLSDENVQK